MIYRCVQNYAVCLCQETNSVNDHDIQVCTNNVYIYMIAYDIHNLQHVYIFGICSVMQH